MTDDLTTLSQFFSKLPGLGKRSARRIVLYLLQNRESLMLPLAAQLARTAETVKICEICGNLDTHSPCNICTHSNRDHHTICVVEEVADLWAVERSATYKGLYHVLGGTLSAIDGRGPDQLNIQQLIDRTQRHKVKEIILATNATVEGQTTAHYITERLKGLGIHFSRIAYGVPVGGELDYLDDGTLGAALSARQPF